MLKHLIATDGGRRSGQRKEFSFLLVPASSSSPNKHQKGGKGTQIKKAALALRPTSVPEAVSLLQTLNSLHQTLNSFTQEIPNRILLALSCLKSCEMLHGREGNRQVS